MAEDKKKFLDADGLKHFWEMCRLQSNEDFQTTLEIFDAMASALEKLKEDVGMPEELPDDIKNLYELVEKNKNQSIVNFQVDYDNDLIYLVTGEKKVLTVPLINKADKFWLASDKKTGLVKMYFEPGQNEDGTMTQKAITEALNNKVGAKVENNTLVFTK